MKIPLNKEDRQRVIESLFDEMATSSFAEGCQEKIVRGLEARTDKQLVALAYKHNTWLGLDN